MKVLIFGLLFICQALVSQTVLTRSAPEAEGVSSAAIDSFLQAVSKSRNELHGIVFLRHGKIIADAWSKPYADSLKHTMYSTSKSFTSTAIGFAVSERKLTINDKVVSFFPEQVPENASAFLQNLTIKHLLTMTVGHPSDPTGQIIQKPGWIRSFLATPIVDTPGTKFLYNSMATFMLSAIVQKVTGEKVIDYLEPRLFKPLGITNKDWETNAEGINVGGWGLRIRTMDMAKLGQLYLQKGKWNGKQILPVSWVEEASRAHIIQDRNATQEQRSKSDWLQGYGYQFWRSRHNSFRADGAFGQYILIFPELDAVIAITSETPDMQDELNLVWQYLYPAMKPAALRANGSAVSKMKKTASVLEVNPFRMAADSAAASPDPGIVSSRAVKLKKNNKDFVGLSFDVSKDVIKVKVQTSGGIYPVSFGKNEWVAGSTSLKGPSLTGGAVNSLAGLAPFKTTGKFKWKNPTTLELVLQYIESPHRQIWTCYFADNNFRMEMRSSTAIMREDKIDETLIEDAAF